MSTPDRREMLDHDATGLSIRRQCALLTIDRFLVRWLSRKYKRFRGHPMKQWEWLRSLKRRRLDLFAHWTLKPMAG